MKEPFKLAEKQNRWLQDKARKKKNPPRRPHSERAGGLRGRRRRRRGFPSAWPRDGSNPPAPDPGLGWGSPGGAAGIRASRGGDAWAAVGAWPGA